MSSARAPAVAGLFYPSEPHQLAGEVERLLAAAEGLAIEEPPRAIVAPHAGYIYSGPIAAAAYARLRRARGRIKRVVVVGPSHHVAFKGLAISTAAQFDTPLGPLAVDPAAAHLATRLHQLRLLDEPHRLEHAIEVHLPFIIAVLGPVAIVPLVAGEIEPSAIAEVIEALWQGTETLVVISSDLSHYHDYDTARRMDRATSDAIEALDADAIGRDQACGQVPIAALLALARARGLAARTIDQRNSGDAAGPRDRVVGYGAYVFH